MAWRKTNRFIYSLLHKSVD